VAAAAGVIRSLPVLVREVWSFVKPALGREARQMQIPFGFGTLFFFALVGLFAYLVTPIAVSFLATFLGGNAVYVSDRNAHLTFLALVVLIFGSSFGIPCVFR
jgi:sec-independent protein translocase protein TatC